MNLDKLGHWISIIANVGVFVGFILVAYQLQLNTKALETTAYHKSSELFSNAEMALMGDTGAAALSKAMLEPEAINDAELMQVWSYFSMGFLAASQAYSDYRNEVITEDRWLYIADLYISYINHPIGLMYWESGRSVYSDPLMNEYIDALQERLDATPKNLTQQQFQQIAEKIQELPQDNTDTTAFQCSLELFNSFETQLQITDTQGHGPDIGSDEWKSAIEYKLGVRGNADVPQRNAPEWCTFIARKLDIDL